jgi:hypothetical protein
MITMIYWLYYLKYQKYISNQIFSKSI